MPRLTLDEDCPSEVLAAVVEQGNATSAFLEALRNQLVARGLALNLPALPAQITVKRRS